MWILDGVWLVALLLVHRSRQMVVLEWLSLVLAEGHEFDCPCPCTR